MDIETLTLYGILLLPTALLIAVGVVALWIQRMWRRARARRFDESGVTAVETKQVDVKPSSPTSEDVLDSDEDILGRYDDLDADEEIPFDLDGKPRLDDLGTGSASEVLRPPKTGS